VRNHPNDSAHPHLQTPQGSNNTQARGRSRKPSHLSATCSKARAEQQSKMCEYKARVNLIYCPTSSRRPCRPTSPCTLAQIWRWHLVNPCDPAEFGPRRPDTEQSRPRRAKSTACNVRDAQIGTRRGAKIPRSAKPTRPGRNETERGLPIRISPGLGGIAPARPRSTETRARGKLDLSERARDRSLFETPLRRRCTVPVAGRPSRRRGDEAGERLRFLGCSE
jgi:hypothetical protein